MPCIMPPVFLPIVVNQLRACPYWLHSGLVELREPSGEPVATICDAAPCGRSQRLNHPKHITFRLGAPSDSPWQPLSSMARHGIIEWVSSNNIVRVEWHVLWVLLVGSYGLQNCGTLLLVFSGSSKPWQGRPCRLVFLVGLPKHVLCQK